MVVATGFFDGVHLGHVQVLQTLAEAAASRGCASCVATFWPHPRTVLQDGARELRLLTTLQQKKARILSLGIDRVEVIPFSKDFASLTAEQYLRDILQKGMGAQAVLLGYDNRLGSDRATPDKAEAIARSLGLDVIRSQEVPSSDGGAISSTKIRQALAEGWVESAADMLGYSYSLEGVVVAGNRIGRTLGYPTANMCLYEPLMALPAMGAYLVRVHTVGKTLFGMCNIGIRPTLGQNNLPSIETHILDFEEDIYGLDIRIEFLRHLRSEKRFPSLDDLREQLSADEALCRSLINHRPVA